LARRPPGRRRVRGAQHGARPLHARGRPRFLELERGEPGLAVGRRGSHPARAAWIATMLEKWVPFRLDRGFVRCRLFCFPHAGGNATAYQSLRRLMPPDIDLCPVELLGRAARIDEPAIRNMGELIDMLSDALRPLLDVPFAFFGHSVGACIAY